MSSLHMNTVALKEAKSERATPYQHPFQCSKDLVTDMIYKTTVKHEWRREIINEYLVEMKTALNWDASAEGEELGLYPGCLNDDEEVYPDVPPPTGDFEDLPNDVCGDFNSDEDVDLGSEVSACFCSLHFNRFYYQPCFEELLFSGDYGAAIKNEPVD